MQNKSNDFRLANWLPVWTVVIAVALVAATSLAAVAVAGTKTVSVKDNVFSPTSTTVAKGTTVKWVWRGSNPHNVVSTSAPSGSSFRSGKPKTSGSYKRTLKRAGKYKLVCEVHFNMKMTIRVK